MACVFGTYLPPGILYILLCSDDGLRIYVLVVIIFLGGGEGGGGGRARWPYG